MSGDTQPSHYHAVYRACIKEAALAGGELMQATLRGRALDRVPFYDRRKVVALLDDLPRRPPAALAALDPVLMQILSSCVLASRFGIS